MTQLHRGRTIWLPPFLALLAGGSMVLAGRSSAGPVIIGLGVLGLVLTWRFPVGAGRCLGRIHELLAGAIGVLARMMMTITYLVTILPAWIVHAGRFPAGSKRPTWHRVSTTGQLAHPPYDAETRAVRQRADIKLAVTALAMICLAAVAVPSVRQSSSTGLVDRASLGQSPIALRAQADSSSVLVEQDRVFSARIDDPQLGWRLGTVRGRFVNEISGERSTPVPPDVGTNPLRIWFFGASSVWGLGQSDSATTPARFAALATARGIPVVARNFAVPAYNSDQSSRALVQRLSATDAPPDLVVFIDGYNEFYTEMASTLAGVAPGTPFLSYGGRGSTGVAASYRAGPVSLAQRYAGVERSVVPARRRAIRAAREVGAAVVFAWQPSAHSGPLRPGEATTLEQLGWSTTELRALSVADRHVRRNLPSSVIDLGSVFDGEDQPIYLDTVHTNERGADIVARTLVDDLWGRLTDLQTRPRTNREEPRHG